MNEKARALVARIMGNFGIESSVEIPINQIKPFKDHPFKVLDDDKMVELVESISKGGVLVPVIVRPCDGWYEMISGHRRMHAAKKVGLEKIPAIVRSLSDDDATIVMVDSNYQRGEWLTSEKAFALKMRMDASRRQGERRDLSCGNNGHKLKGKKARDIVAEDYNMSGKSVQRYVRLTKLIPELWDLVDKRKLNIVCADLLAGFDSYKQEVVFEYIQSNRSISKAQLEKLRDSRANERGEILAVLTLGQNDINAHNHIKLNKDKLNKYFNTDCTDDEREKIIWKLLEQWSKNNS